MNRPISLLLVLFVMCGALLYTQPTDAKKYGGYSTYRNYNSNNYYRQQQAYRNTQAIQRQQQQAIARQNQQRAIAQQRAARDAAMRQQRIIRDRQVRMRNAAIARQRATAQRTQQARLSKDKLRKQANTLKQRNLLKDQRKLKERQKRLRELSDKKRRSSGDKASSAELMTLASFRNTSAQFRNSTPRTVQQFKTSRESQRLDSSITRSVNKTRLLAQNKLERANQLRKQLHTKSGSGSGGGKKPPGGKAPPGGGDDGGDGKKPQKLSDIFRKAANNFASCSSGKCSSSIGHPKRPSNKQIWTSTSQLTSVSNAFEHWKRHRKDFPEYQNAKQYVRAATNFLNTPPPGALVKRRSNGDTLVYDPKTNVFGVKSSSGAPRTMFRPKDGMRYWEKQRG